MGWHISKALMKDFENSRFSPEQVEEFSADNSSDGARSALSNGNPTPPLFLHSDRMTAFSRLSRFGMTFGLLTDDLGEELLTWFRAGFPARTSAPPAEVRGLTENVRDSGEKWPGSSARYDPVSRSWKTPQFSLLGDLEPFSETWPRWGMTAGGEFFPLPTPERRTCGSESGSLLPTPQARDHFPAHSQEYIAEKKAQGHGMSNLNDHVRWQTPVADDAVNWENGKINSRGEPKLSAQVKLWPTPRAQDREGL